MRPPVAVTQRDRTPVTPTRPTFCENDVYGNVLKIPPRMVPTPSARSPARDRGLVDPASGHFAERQKHAGRFDHHHDHHNAHGDDRHHLKLRNAEAQRRDDIDPRRRNDFVDMHDAEQRRQNGAGNDAEQYRHVADEAFEEAQQRKDDQEYEQRDAQALELVVGRVGKGAFGTVDNLGQGRQAAARPIDADPH